LPLRKPCGFTHGYEFGFEYVVMRGKSRFLHALIMRKKALDRKMRAIYESECTKGMANPGSMSAKRRRMRKVTVERCRVFLDHSLAQTPGRNVPWQAFLQSTQGRCPCVPAGRQSHELMEVHGGLSSQSKNILINCPVS
jgi:hypothetical protein